ncbi:ROK family transcriptional regulator [Mangrovactinospora gilvigrisea]|uniref:ROK family transcriptional regulator n=1 Tax=Mangrovactinospora gilvigrisea TaxID=1428644 RepID=UPI000AD0129C|nr:ROK family transcriptional regulator [Mangrovactinospora gilvigrisea]
MPTTPAGTPRLLRAINDRAALELLLAHGPLTRGRLGTLTGLSKPTVSQVLSRLEKARLVEPDDSAPDGTRRPGPAAQTYRVRADAAHVAGLDVTHHRIHAAVADLTGRVLGEATVPARRTKPIRAVGEALDAALRDAGVARDRIRHTTVGTPGTFDPATGALRYAEHMAGWHHRTAVRETAELLGTPVEFENDVNLAAVAEQQLGTTAGVEDFVLFWAGADGIGLAVVLGGRLHRGATGGAGEVGYLWQPGNTVHSLAGNAMGGLHELAGPAGIRRLAEERGLTAGSAAEALAAGHPGVLDEAALRYATALASIVSVLDPELVVLSGELPTAGGEPLRQRIAERMADISIAAPRVLLTPVQGHPVLVGAVHNSLATVREDLFAGLS